MKARCIQPVQLYDAGLTGIYKIGQIVDGEVAERVLAEYPAYFEEVEQVEQVEEVKESA
jgi:hypothetical protein